VPQQLVRENAVSPSPICSCVASLAGKGEDGASARLHLSQAAAYIARAAAHGAGLAAAGVQEHEVEVAPSALDALQHVLHAQRLVVEQRILLHLLHRNEVVDVVGLHAVAWKHEPSRVVLS
jgi:hypothetical protein